MFNLRLSNIYLEEKDIFILFFGLFLLLGWIFHLNFFPFRFASLLVVWFFLLTTRSLISYLKFDHYFFIVIAGLIFSLFLSPYGLAIYLFLATFGYKKMIK